MKNFSQLLYKSLLEIFRYYACGHFRNNREFYFRFTLTYLLLIFFASYALTYFVMKIEGEAPVSILHDFLKPVNDSRYKELFLGFLTAFHTAILFSVFELIYTGKSKELKIKNENLIGIISNSKGALPIFVVIATFHVLHYLYLINTMNGYTDFIAYYNPILDISPVSSMLIKDFLYALPVIISAIWFFRTYAIKKVKFSIAPIVVALLLNVLLEGMILHVSENISTRINNIFYSLSVDNLFSFIFSNFSIIFVCIWITLPAMFISLVFPIYYQLKKTGSLNENNFRQHDADEEILV